MIDTIDEKILNLIQTDARATNADIARHIGLTPSATLERVRKLQDSGVLAGYAGRVNPKSIGLGLLAFVFVRTGEVKDPRSIAKRLAAIPEAIEVHNIAGEDCYIVKLRASDPEDLSRLLHDKIKKIQGIRSTRTTIVLETFKETTVLPVDRARLIQGEGR
jgi:Lrp/AsnC family leucine-responsive transcriptional regulator